MTAAAKPDTPRAAVRRLLAGGQWHPAADLLARAGEIDPAACLKAYERLLRAGSTKAGGTPAERLDIGRARVVREALQHLTHAGEVEAAGDGDARLYRLTGAASVLTPKPRPTREYLPLERLVFLEALQMRVPHLTHAGEIQLYDEATVARYVADMEDGDTFPPLEVVRFKSRPEWVIAGFNRGEAYRRRGANSVDCLVYPGTLDDARLWALSQNAKSPKERTAADCQRAFDTLMSDKKLLDRVIEAAKGNGGVQRGLAAACGLGGSIIDKYLKRHGLRATRDGRLEAIPVPVRDTDPEPTPDPEPAADPTPDPAPDPNLARAGETDHPPEATSPDVAGPAPTRPAVDEADPLAGAKAAVADIQRDMRRVGKAVEDILRSTAGDLLRAAAKTHGLPLAVETQDRHRIGGNPNGEVARVETWPGFKAVQAVFGDLANSLHAGG